jgi:hypothetical protein
VALTSDLDIIGTWIGGVEQSYVGSELL